MKFQSLVFSLKDEIESKLKNLGFDLVELKCFQTGSSQTLRITINDPKEHVGHKQCILVSKAIQKIIPDLENYNLEVFSPGIGRELKEAKDFEIFKGKLIEITFLNEKQPQEIGWLEERTESELIIMQENDEQKKSFLISDLKKVVLALEKNKENITEISVEDI